VDVINSGVRDIEKALYSPQVQGQLVPRGPQTLYEKTKTFETIDTEDKDLKYIVRPDGTLVTEEKKTTAHEEIRDEELSDDNDLLMGPNETRIDHVRNSLVMVVTHWHLLISGIITTVLKATRQTGN
jgi:hypothetical protein